MPFTRLVVCVHNTVDFCFDKFDTNNADNIVKCKRHPLYRHAINPLERTWDESSN